MPIGTVMKFDSERGFGLIRAVGERDLFVHVSEVNDEVKALKVGEEVEFVLGQARDGRTCAQNVRRFGGQEAAPASRFSDDVDAGLHRVLER